MTSIQVNSKVLIASLCFKIVKGEKIAQPFDTGSIKQSMAVGKEQASVHKF